MSAIYICTLRFGWQASICNGGLAGSIHDGREGVPSVVWWVAWQGIFWFNCWIGTVDWDMWFWMFLVQGCNQVPDHCKMGRWAPNASSLWRQLGWNRKLWGNCPTSVCLDYTFIACVPDHYMLLLLKVWPPPCLFSSSEHLMSLTPPNSDYSLKASACFQVCNCMHWVYYWTTCFFRLWDWDCFKWTWNWMQVHVVLNAP